MPIYDISRSLNRETKVWPGDPPFIKQSIADHQSGDGYALSTLSMSAHAGTHLDLPAHFSAQGQTAEAVPPERFILKTALIAVPPGAPIGADLIASLPGGTEAVLFQTSPESTEGAASESPHYRGLTRDLITQLTALRISLVGVDQLTVDDPASDSFDVHRRLSSAGILVLEGAALSHVPPGAYTLIALPLKIDGGEASPTRAILITPPLDISK